MGVTEKGSLAKDLSRILPASTPPYPQRPQTDGRPILDGSSELSHVGQVHADDLPRRFGALLEVSALTLGHA